MTKSVISATLVALFATPAFGADLTASLGGAVEYDSNVFRRERNKEDDVLFSLRPGVKVHEDRGDDLNFAVGYELPVEFAVDNNEELQDEDHVFDADFSYHVNDRVQIFGDDQFRYLRGILRTVRVDNAEVEAGRGFPTFSEERERVRTNDARLGASYLFSPRLMGRVVGGMDFFDSSRSDRSKNYSVSGTGDLLYVLTPKHQVGGGVSYAFQDFDDREGFEGSTSNTYQVFGSWRWTVQPTLHFDLTAGPAYIESEQDDAAVVRQSTTAPFAVLPGGVVNGIVFDKNGNPLNRPTVAPGTLLVPSFFSNAGGGPGQNCGNINGIPVAQTCPGNVVLDPTADAVEIAAVQAPLAVTNVNPAGGDDEDLTVFATAVLSKSWSPSLATALRYTRRQNNGSGLGGTVILDAISLANTWDINDRWQLALRGDWTNRESVFRLRQSLDQVAPQTVGAGTVPLAVRNGVAFNAARRTQIDTRRWGVAARVTHRLFRSTRLFAQVRYDEQESDSGTLGRQTDFENILATFGVQHSFEPIKLW